MTDQVDGTDAHVQTCALCGETFDSVASMDAHFSPRGRCRDPWTAQSHGRYLFRVRLSRPNPVVWSLDHPTEAAS